MWLSLCKEHLRSPCGERCGWGETPWMEAGDVSAAPSSMGKLPPKGFTRVCFSVCSLRASHFCKTEVCCLARYIYKGECYLIHFKKHKNRFCGDDDRFLQGCTPFSTAHQHVGQNMVKEQVAPVALGLMWVQSQYHEECGSSRTSLCLGIL